MHIITLVFDERYLKKAKKTLKQIRKKGNYAGEVLCIIPDSLSVDYVTDNLNDFNLTVFSFPPIDRTVELRTLEKYPLQKTDGREFTKTFQWHKLYLFHPKVLELKKKIIYIDCGMRVFSDISPLLRIDPKRNLLAHSDAYPYYESRLSGQFDNLNYSDLFSKLNKKFNLNIDYFQSTIMLYDTASIPSDAFPSLLDLSRKYINSKTNEQGIMNIYFNCHLKIWRQLPLMEGKKYIYDFSERGANSKKQYVLLKYPKRSKLILLAKKLVIFVFFNRKIKS